MTTVPDAARQRIDELLTRAGVTGARAREMRSDLERHVLDGLDAGKPLDEVLDRLGDPKTAAPLLARGADPPGRIGSSGGLAGFFGSVSADLRFALRGLAHAPTFAVTAVVVLALGIGANTVVFTLLNEVLLRPIPVENPDELVDVWADVPGGNSFLGVSYQDYRTLRDENSVLVRLAAFTGQRLDLGSAGQERQVVAQFVAPIYFEMLGLRPTVGSTSFDPDAPFGGPPVAVLTHALWQDAYAADPDIVGTSILLQGRTVTVVGVGPPGVRGHFIGFPSDVWLPLQALDPLVPGFDADDRSAKLLEMIGRRRPGVTVGEVAANLNSIAANIEAQFPVLNRGHRVGVTATTGLDHSLAPGITAFVLILTAVAGMVLLIACLNVGSVLLVRAMSRDRELAVRIAIGAGRGRLLRQLFTEASLLALLGTAAGVGVAVWLNGVGSDFLRASGGGIGLDLGVDWTVLGLTAAAAALAAGIASLAPALHVLRKDPSAALRSRDGRSRASARIRTILVVGQVAVSVVLVVATGLLVRSLIAGNRADPGFAADRLATFTLHLDGVEAGIPRGGVEGEILDGLATLPGIEDVVVADRPPLGVVRTPVSITLPGVPPPAELDAWVVDGRRVGAGYLGALGVEVEAGRDFTAADEDEGLTVAVVSAAFVRRFFPDADAMGRVILVDDEPVSIIGVAKDARYVVQDDTPDALVYLSRAGAVWPSVQVTLTGAAPATAVGAVQAVVSASVPGHRRVILTSARQVMRDALLPQRMAALIIGAMGVIALLMAAVGLYGLVQFTVARDTRELGIRIALGGGGRDVVFSVVRKGFALVGLGTGIGVAAALVLAPGLGTFLVGVGPADPVTYLGVIATFTVVAVVASWAPARRALRLDPIVVLREE